MLTLLASLWANPLARKLALWAALALAAGLALRWYGNRQWAQGEAQGRQTMAREMERQKRKEWEARERELATAAADLDAEKHSLAAAADQIARERANLSRSLNDALERIRAERTHNYADAAAVPDSVIWRDIRVVSGQLAAHP
jgi:uncharacterized protein HemX